jgi:hypothetical protein
MRGGRGGVCAAPSTLKLPAFAADHDDERA